MRDALFPALRIYPAAVHRPLKSVGDRENISGKRERHSPPVLPPESEPRLGAAAAGRRGLPCETPRGRPTPAAAVGHQAEAAARGVQGVQDDADQAATEVEPRLVHVRQRRRGFAEAETPAEVDRRRVELGQRERGGGGGEEGRQGGEAEGESGAGGHVTRRVSSRGWGRNLAETCAKCLGVGGASIIWNLYCY